jgi:hypothetical protein
LSNSAQALQRRFTLSSNPADATSAVATYRRACEAGPGLGPLAVLAAADSWIEWSAERAAWDEGAEAARAGIAAAEALFRAQLLRSHKEARLQRAQAIFGGAAHALAMNDETAAAALALERGRAIMLTEAIQRDRADLQELRARGAAGFADRYTAAVARVRLLSRSLGAGVHRSTA